MSKPSLLVPVICVLGAAGFVIASTVQAPETPKRPVSAAGSTAPGAEGAAASETPGVPSETPGSETPGSETPGSQTPGSETPGSQSPGSSSPGGGYGSPTSSPTTGGGAPADGPAVVLSTINTRIGIVVVGPGGRTLYRFKNDTARPPTSNCYQGCAIGFPPVLATGRIQVTGIDPALIGQTRRTDGKYQVTLAGWPLYRFNGENGPHQLAGEGVRNLWHAIGPNGQPAVNN
jgi:predicted lipoprotein with Yx(FWY)xxD motif